MPHPAQVKPEKVLSTFRVADGFQIELVASEPLVADPVAMEVDEYGRIYVVEMHGYPLDKSGTGRIKLLTDTNNDGKPDKSTVFAKGLTLPTGIMRWKKGVLVTDAPHVLYLEDTDGDNRSDVRKVMLTGFALSNPQHNLNTPLYGLDNWIYLGHESAITPTIYTDAFGDKGGDVHFPERSNGPRLPHNAEGRTVRFRPDSYQLEMMSGETQFGHTFDVWGHQFLVSNAHHGFQERIAARYLARNPALQVADATQNLPDHGDAAEVFPITENPEHQLLTDVGVMTSACGITSYQGGLFPRQYQDVLFFAEPVHNLVHADRLQSRGSGFVTSRLLAGKEFLASTDSWFRPVNFYIGPDGALYVIDYYRQYIEHPEWMSEEMGKSEELYNGTYQGRIYRITPKGTPPMDWCGRIQLGQASDAELVRALANPNGWWRRQAQRLLVDRQSRVSYSLLNRMFHESPSPLGRLHALWTLQGLKQLTTARIGQALRDSVAGVRENAIRLAELYLPAQPGLEDYLLPLEDDTDPKVRFQLLCTLGSLRSEAAREVCRNILFRDLEDEWVQIAALTATDAQEMNLFRQALVQSASRQTPGRKAFFQRLSTLIGRQQRPDEIKRILQQVTASRQSATEWWRAATLNGLVEGLGSQIPATEDLTQIQQSLARNFFGYRSHELRQAVLSWFKKTGLPEGKVTARVLKKAARTIDRRRTAPYLRVDAIGLLELNTPSEQLTRSLKQLISPREPVPVQKAAVQALSRISDKTLAPFLLARWNGLTPGVREDVLNFLIDDPGRAALLLNAVKQGKMQTSAIGWHRSVELMMHPDERLRKQARGLFEEKPDFRQTVLEKYQPALRMDGSAVRGKEVFTRVCASCHQVGGKIGRAFGPDLISVRNRSAASLLSEILMPGRSIADGYELWTLKPKKGEMLTGIISKETSLSITLKQLNGEERTIPRNAIESLTVSTTSAMPVGLEASITVRQMADLLAYLKGADWEKDS